MAGRQIPVSKSEVPIGSLTRSKLTGQQIIGFWAAWSGWALDGMDSFIYALVLAPAMTELLPRSGLAATPGNVGLAGSVLFAVFLVGWGLSFVWGPVSDLFGRTRALAATVFVYALFTTIAAFSHNLYQLGLFRLLAGVGIGGEWAVAGTYVSEAWPEDRRKMGAGYLQTGYYVGFFLAAALNYTVGAHFGWRAMFLCGSLPVVVSLVITARVKEPERWKHSHRNITQRTPLREIFRIHYRRRTVINTALLTVAICGLWAGTVYEPTAILALAEKAGMGLSAANHMASFGTSLLSVGTILGCVALPPVAERFGRKPTLALYFCGMMICIVLCFGWAFYIANGLRVFMELIFFLGFFGGNFAMFTLWLPEQYDTSVRATAFAFATSFGRFVCAGLNFFVGALVRHMGTLGMPVAFTGIAFAIGLILIPFAIETRGRKLPN
jgi:MFS family permease